MPLNVTVEGPEYRNIPRNVGFFDDINKPLHNRFWSAVASYSMSDSEAQNIPPSGDPREEFIIGVDSGSVQLARQLDCETQNLYNLTISLSDSHRTVYTYVGLARSLVHVTATDNDVTSQLIYSVHNSRSVTSLELFDLDHVTGLLTVAQPLDRESISEHILTVVVSDSSSPVKRNFARVIVHVTDSNDHAPQWSGGVVQAVVLENAFVGSRVVTVVATDRDHGANAAVTYAIVSGNVGNYFSIDPVMGDISVARDLDCEEAAEFNLIVRAVDQGSAPLASTLPVFVTVRQSDHAPPRFEEIRAVAEVEESVAVGWIVWQARARSALSLTYDIEDDNSTESSS
ncbi:fat-like cadherin-related tumor suppressor homolog [Homalodisca vitripennis]|uniref:fat-like cadherin-related tumor suppressor homolog n=1 Tax=Homalodisca vitripennis TaxID=197043 RepID=UPI001EEBDCA8|nr:fat-like cadherin-related tumor suppressor homolog [Homalodisca vitripennis]